MLIFFTFVSIKVEQKVPLMGTGTLDLGNRDQNNKARPGIAALEYLTTR